MLTTEFSENVNWPPQRVKKLTFRVLALRQSDWRNCGLCVGFMQKVDFLTFFREIYKKTGNYGTFSYLTAHLSSSPRLVAL